MIELYMSNSCPFCQKVLRAVQQFGLEEGKDFTTIDAAIGTPGRKVVLSVGGKGMVPFLIDGETSMYESNDIIAYLKENVGKP
ncbi:MAG: glutathione S-transferase N-terminal domain-containing protein [Desulforhopalus sp.]